MNIELIKNVIKQLEPNVRVYENIIKEKDKDIITLTLIDDCDNTSAQVARQMVDAIKTAKTPDVINTPAGRILTGSVEPPHVGLISKAVNESQNTNYELKDPVNLNPTEAARKMGIPVTIPAIERVTIQPIIKSSTAEIKTIGGTNNSIELVDALKNPIDENTDIV